MVDDAHLALACTPGGQLYLDSRPGAPGGGLFSRRRANALLDAFSAELGGGLVHLAGAELERELPASLAFGRQLGQRYLEALCHQPDLEIRRADLEIAAPMDALTDLAEATPPMRGGEYVTGEVLERAWHAIEAAVRRELALSSGTVADYLHNKSPLWRVVGRVCFHLAENRRDPAHPFAFMATYGREVTAGARVRHAPLKAALREFAADRDGLLRLLEPVHRAAQASDFVRELVDTRALFQPQAWTAAQAHSFLQDAEACERSGVVVRLPDWWRAKSKPRPQVRVTLGERKAEGVGVDAMLDFRVELVLGGELLTEPELRGLLAGVDGLQLLRGRWVEVDTSRIRAVLEHWRSAERAVAGDGVSFSTALRLLHGLPAHDDLFENDLEDSERAAWTQVSAGRWLERLLADLRAPGSTEADPGEALKATLRPYQRDGVAWMWLLARLGLGGCLTDDMGLGKTIQVLALLLLLKRAGKRGPAPGPHLVVVPASLLGNWRAEQLRFAPSLRVAVAHGSAGAGAMEQLEARLSRPRHGLDVVLTTYGMVARTDWIRRVRWGLVAVDEAQAIKNPGTRQTRSVKALTSRIRLALTGTPVENHPGDLWSLFDFTSPGLLGTQAVFREQVRQLEQRRGGYASLRALLSPYILRRMKTDRRIIADLPDKIEVPVHCGLTKLQIALYERSLEELANLLSGVDGIQRRGVVLAFLQRFKQICNHPSQWLGDGAYKPSDSAKFGRLRELCEPIVDRQEKALVFTQFRELTRPLADFLETVFGRAGLVLTGRTPVKRRPALVEQFQDERGPPFFVISLKAGGTGLNLTAASHVIHFDRWWNPAIEDQATDRAFRIGQKKNVMVHKFVCRGTVEEKIDAMIREKQALSKELLGGDADRKLTELETDELLRVVSLDITTALAEEA